MALNKVEICGVNTSKLPLLTGEEKEQLFARILKGDKEARELYIKGNLRLVLSVIQRFSGSSQGQRSARYQQGVKNNVRKKIRIRTSFKYVPIKGGK